MNEHVLQKLETDIKLRGLRETTMNDYVQRTEIFLKWAGRPATELGEQDIAKFLTYLIEEKKLKAGTVNSYNAALRFFFGVTMNLNLNYKQLPRQKQRRKIPDILTREELTAMFDACDNLRDKALLMIIYSSGLRLSEAINLRVKDIDSKTMRVFISSGKGDRDRFTILSHATLEVLREYWKKYRPKDWLFLTKLGTPVTVRGLQDIFKKYRKKVGITKKVSVHTLRHSFATHLLEGGTNIIYIKQVLGHTHIQSTTFYLQVANIEKDMKSPLDNFNTPKKRGRKPKTVSPGDSDNG